MSVAIQVPFAPGRAPAASAPESNMTVLVSHFSCPEDRRLSSISLGEAPGDTRDTPRDHG
jgi:hypothetical protein